jgi:hypothetical protein
VREVVPGFRAGWRSSPMRAPIGQDMYAYWRAMAIR